MIEIAGGDAPPDAVVRVPGSKYEANRLLTVAALTEGETRIEGVPRNEDIEAAVAAYAALGARIEDDASSGALRVTGIAPDAAPREEVSVSVGESGTLLRFLTAAAATLPFPVRINGSGRIHLRPIADLVNALQQLGAEIEMSDGHAPLVVLSPVTRGGEVRVAADTSSQFASALLLVAPRIPGELVVELTGEPVSRSYLDLTASVMARCGVTVEREGNRRFRVEAGARYTPGVHRVSGDWSSASYFFAAAAIAGGSVTVVGLDAHSPQGERGFPALLSRMGCEVHEEEHDDGLWVSVRGRDPNYHRLRGLSVDMGSMPDAAPTLAAMAPFAETPTRIGGIGHLRHKESDRIAALAEGLTRLGATVTVRDDGLVIQPVVERKLRPADINPHGDHRIAMALALTGLRVPGVRITNPDVVAKSFPGYWNALRELGARVSPVSEAEGTAR